MEKVLNIQSTRMLTLSTMNLCIVALREKYFDLLQRVLSTDILSLKASLSTAAKNVQIKNI